MSEFLLLAFVFLVSGVIAVLIASRLGLGSVLGYLIAGIAISPLLHALGVDVIAIQHFAEFGVVMMLFLVGLELEPKMLWSMRAKLFGLGGLQVGFTTLLVMAVAMLFGQPWTIALAIGFVLALSSTAIVLQAPGLFIIYDKIVVPRFAQSQSKTADEIDEEGDIIIAGHGRFGGIVNRMLRAAGYSTTVLDYSALHLDTLRSFGFKVFFGDATRPDLLHAAGIHEARLLIIAIDDKNQINALVHHVKQHYPNLPIIARAVDRRHVYDLFAAGCGEIIRETFDSSVRMGRTAFELLGMHEFEAELLARKFT